MRVIGRATGHLESRLTLRLRDSEYNTLDFMCIFLYIKQRFLVFKKYFMKEVQEEFFLTLRSHFSFYFYDEKNWIPVKLKNSKNSNAVVNYTNFSFTD